MTHVMLDLETFGTKPGCVIRSIGAVAFELDGTLGPTFYANVDKASALAAGLKVDPKTERWWAEQSLDARAALDVDPQPLRDVVVSFRNWWRTVGGRQFWSQGANFDGPLLEAAYDAVGEPVPWVFWNARDTRTVYEICGYDTRNLTRERTHHNALDDTLHQVALVVAALRKAELIAPAPAMDIFG